MLEGSAVHSPQGSVVPAEELRKFLMHHLTPEQGQMVLDIGVRDIKDIPFITAETLPMDFPAFKLSRLV